MFSSIIVVIVVEAVVVHVYVEFNAEVFWQVTSAEHTLVRRHKNHTTKQHTDSRNKGRREVTSVIRVESNVSGRGGGAFSSTAEVWDGGWRAVRAVMVCGCLLRSLLEPILSVTAGGSGRRRRPVEETEGKSMELLETILSLGTTLTLTQLSGLYTSA